MYVVVVGGDFDHLFEIAIYHFLFYFLTLTYWVLLNQLSRMNQPNRIPQKLLSLGTIKASQAVVLNEDM